MTKQELITWYQDECMDNMTAPKEVLDKLFELEETNSFFTFEEACKPLMKYLCENHHPHIKVVIDGNTANLLEGIEYFKSNEFIID